MRPHALRNDNPRPDGRRLALVTPLLAAMLTAAPPPALGQVPDAVKASTVKLTAAGEASDPARMGGRVTATATGVLISEDGLVLTTYHLLEKLGAVFPGSVTVTADVAHRGQLQRAWVLDAKPATDLLLLRLRAPGPYPFVELGSAFGMGADAAVHTYGFPGEDAFDFTQSGRITSTTPDGGFLWATDLSLSEGLSGSPVVDDGGRLVGIAKGSLPTLGSGMIIPIDLADPILAFVRFARLERQSGEIAALKARIAELETALEPLRRELAWSAALDGDVVRITAERRFGNAPVGPVALAVTPILVSGAASTPLGFSLTAALDPATVEATTVYEWRPVGTIPTLRQLATQAGGTLGFELRISPEVAGAFEPVTLEIR